MQKVEEFCKAIEQGYRQFFAVKLLKYALTKERTEFFKHINQLSLQYIGKELSQEEILTVWLYVLELTWKGGKAFLHRWVSLFEYPYIVQVYTRGEEYTKIRGDREYYITKDGITKGISYKGFNYLEDALEFIFELERLQEDEEQTDIILYKESNVSIHFDRWVRGISTTNINMRVETDDSYMHIGIVEIRSMSVEALLRLLGDKFYAADYLDRLLDFGKGYLQEVREIFGEDVPDMTGVSWGSKDEKIEVVVMGHMGSEFEKKLTKRVEELIGQKNLLFPRFLQEKQLLSGLQRISI